MVDLGPPVTRPLEIRPMLSRHLRSVAAIDAASHPRAWSRELWRAELRREHRIYLVATLGRIVVGYAGVLIAVDEAHLMTIASHPDHRGRGVATRLLLAAVDEAVELGCTTLTLEVRQSNAAAQGLYARFGMVPVGVRRGYYEPGGEDAMVMSVHDIDADPYRALLDEIATTLENAA